MIKQFIGLLFLFLCFSSVDAQKASFSLGAKNSDIKGVERVCYEFSGDTLEGWKVILIDPLNNISSIILDKSDNQVTGAVELFDYDCENTLTVEQCWSEIDSSNYYCNYTVNCSQAVAALNPNTGIVSIVYRFIDQFYVNGIAIDLPNYPYTRSCTNDTLNTDLENWFVSNGYDVGDVSLGSIEIASSDICLEYSGFTNGYSSFGFSENPTFVGSSEVEDVYATATACSQTETIDYNVCINKQTGELISVFDSTNKAIKNESDSFFIPENAKPVSCYPEEKEVCNNWTGISKCYVKNAPVLGWYTASLNQQGNFGIGWDIVLTEDNMTITTSGLSSTIDFFWDQVDACLAKGDVVKMCFNTEYITPISEECIFITSLNSQNGNTFVYSSYSNLPEGTYRPRDTRTYCGLDEEGCAAQWVSCDRKTIKWYDGEYELSPLDRKELKTCAIASEETKDECLHTLVKCDSIGNEFLICVKGNGLENDTTLLSGQPLTQVRDFVCRNYVNVLNDDVLDFSLEFSPYIAVPVPSNWISLSFQERLDFVNGIYGWDYNCFYDEGNFKFCIPVSETNEIIWYRRSSAPTSPIGAFFDLEGGFASNETIEKTVEIEGDLENCSDIQVELDVCDKELLYTISGTNGVTEIKWTTSATIDPPRLLPSQTIFTGTNADGLPEYQDATGNPIAPDITQTNSTYVYDGAGLNGIVDYSVLHAYLWVPKTVQLRDINANVEVGEIYMSKCGSELSEVANWNPRNAGVFASVSQGFYELQTYIVDDSPDAAGFRLEWNLNGVWSVVPEEYFFIEEPNVLCRYVEICNDGVKELDGSMITIDAFDSWCDPAVCGSSSGRGSSEENCFQVRNDYLIIDNVGTLFGGVQNTITSITVFDNGNYVTIPSSEVFSGTNGNNQTASMADALNNILDANGYGNYIFQNAVLTGDRYYAWAIGAEVCPFFTITEVLVERNGVTRSMVVDLQEGNLQTVWRRSCEGCNGGYDWIDNFGNAVPLPNAACLIDCSKDYPQIEFSDPTCVALEPVVLCLDTDSDNVADLNVYSITTTCDGVIESVETYDLASVAANINDPDAWTTVSIPTGAVSVTCDGAEVINIEILCDAKGIQHEVRTLTFGGVTYTETYVPSTNNPSTPSGGLSECPPVGSVSEIKVCADGKSAVKKTTVNADGTETVQFLGENGIAFTPSDWEPRDCKHDLIEYYTTTGLNGAIEQLWDIDTIQTTGAVGHLYTDAFRDTDGEGYPLHPKTANSTTVVSGAVTTNVSGTHQAQLDFYLYVPSGGATLREFNATAETVGVWASDACSDVMTERLNAPYTNTSANPLGYFSEGIYRFRLYVHDFSANGIARIQYLNSSGNYVAIPTSWVFQTRPQRKLYKGYLVEGKYYQLDCKTEVDTNANFFSCEEIKCSPSNNVGTSSGSEEVPTIEKPFGQTYTSTAIRNINTLTGGIVQSITICSEAGGFEVSFDGGTSWTYERIRNGCASWGEGNVNLLDVSNMRVRGLSTASDFDVHWEN